MTARSAILTFLIFFGLSVFLGGQMSRFENCSPAVAEQPEDR